MDFLVSPSLKTLRIESTVISSPLRRSYVSMEYTLYFNDANIINSPYYQLQQNDIVYVAPNRPRAMTATYSSATTIWITVLSSLISMTNLIILITKRV